MERCGARRGPARPRPCPRPRLEERLLVLTKASSRGNCQPRNGSSAARKGASPQEGVSEARSGDTARSGWPPPFPVTVPPASSPGDSGGARHGASGAAKIPVPQWWQPCRVQSLPAVGTAQAAGLYPGSGVSCPLQSPQAPRGFCLQSPLLPLLSRTGAHQGDRGGLGHRAGPADPGEFWLQLPPVVPEGPLPAPA
ncbi:small integral membrane protein 35 isoform X1 [Hirundo rustica]|uniref:small integral membrane protein 35 isoform X1 n=1 Tax=Hirundo rustica TaxID=43150 RepID=UPI0026721068|nr:small integral membrane protein 35 isoform X1 [Hirundo rustica]